MSKNYDNWERLVRVVLRRVHDRILALSHSTDTTSIDSASSSSTSFDFDESIAPRPCIPSIPSDYSDLVLDHHEWQAMLPPGKREILFSSASMRFFLDRNGKNCFMLGPANLMFSEENWEVETHPESRFSHVLMPKRDTNIDLVGSINALMLSPKTIYAAYIVFCFTNDQTMPLSPTSFSKLCKDRPNGWKEIQLGEYYVQEGKRVLLCANTLQFASIATKSIVIEGIEFRPSKNQSLKGFVLARLDTPHRVQQFNPESPQRVQQFNLESEDVPESRHFKKGR